MAEPESHLDEHDTLPPSQDPAVGGGVENPPTTFVGIMARIGPGLIIAGSIVGSGELIATTKTGAQAGIALLWLVVIGCVIKVFAQIELGRHAITHGETTLASLDRLPGPRVRVNWVIWLWIVMMCCTVGQLGGIVGGVGQALAITFPMTGDYVDAIKMPSAAEIGRYDEWDDEFLSSFDVALRSHEAPSSGRALDDLSPEGRKWLEETLARTRELAERGFDHPVDDLELQKSLDALREACNRFNLQLVQAAKSDEPDEEKSPLEKLADADPDRQERVVRGHGLLAERLALLEADVDSPGPPRLERAVQAILAVRALARAKVALAEVERETRRARTSDDVDTRRRARQRLGLAEALVASRQAEVDVFVEPDTYDDKYWAAVIAVATAVILYVGRYNLIQNISLVLVVSFTFITIGNVVSLQWSEVFHIPWRDIVRGLSFRAPAAEAGVNPWATAIATFGIIGVGATELIAYPYWCLEKGYGKWTGRRTEDDSWAKRARGWMRVMRFDAFSSMIVYTIATLAFYLMGVAVLFNEGRDPDGMRMVSTLATAYVPVFGTYAKWLFLVGAIAVLYSTFLVANAANARMVTDVLKVVGLVDHHDERLHHRTVGAFSIILPLTCLTVFWSGANPVALVLVAGAMQATFLPILGWAAIHYRFTSVDPRIRPSRVWDVFLVVSSLGLLVAGAYGLWRQIAPYL